MVYVAIHIATKRPTDCCQQAEQLSTQELSSCISRPAYDAYGYHSNEGQDAGTEDDQVPDERGHFAGPVTCQLERWRASDRVRISYSTRPVGLVS